MLSGVLETLLPAGVTAASTQSSHLWDGCDLLPEEAALVAGAVPGRRSEFAAGRACAREALAGLGITGFAVLRGPAREPLWPPGIIGSITHCVGYCAAAAAHSGPLIGLGIDAEQNTVLEPDLCRRIGHETELAGARVATSVDAAVLVFSAKEAFFKAWYPHTGIWLELLDVRVDLEESGASFTVHPASAAARGLDVLTVRGHWATTPTHVFTAATITAAQT